MTAERIKPHLNAEFCNEAHQCPDCCYENLSISEHPCCCCGWGYCYWQPKV